MEYSRRSRPSAPGYRDPDSCMSQALDVHRWVSQDRRERPETARRLSRQRLRWPPNVYRSLSSREAGPLCGAPRSQGGLPASAGTKRSTPVSNCRVPWLHERSARRSSNSADSRERGAERRQGRDRTEAPERSRRFSDGTIWRLRRIRSCRRWSPFWFDRLSVRLTTAHQPRRSDAPHDATTPDRRRLHALVSALGGAAEP